MTVTSAGNERSSATPQMMGDVVKRANEAQAEADLVVSLREMVNNPAFSDVVFLCNDGEPVRASRTILVSRSEVLRSLLANGIAESNCDEITLGGVSSPVMLSVLEFVYTGTLSSYHLQNWKMGWELLIASQFFLLPKLKDMVREFFFENICNVADDLEQAAILLTEAMAFKDLCGEDLCGEADNIFGELVRVLSSDWSDSCFVKSLSEEAFFYLLFNSKSSNYRVDIFSFREYFRFRGVIQWWVHQSNLELSAGEQLMTFLVADIEKLLETCEFLDTAPKWNELRKCWANLQSDKTAKVAMMRLLSNIDYRFIHPRVLAKLVEPLQLYYENIVSAFRFHAFHTTLASREPHYTWRHGPGYYTFENGHVIYRTGITSSSALIAESLCDVNEWEFVIGEGCALFAELGLVHANFNESHEKLSDDPNNYILKSDGKKTIVSNGNDPRNWETLLEEPLETGSIVSFTFDGNKGVCFLKINDDDIGEIWKNLDDEYYPAVSFGNCRQGHMRVQLVRGFDMMDY